MAVDDELNERFRSVLGRTEHISEKKMMGGTCFLLNGNMVGGADRTRDGTGRFMFRVGKDNEAAGQALPGAMPMVQGGRRMRGLFFVAEEDCTPEVMARWMELALEFVATLPKK